MAMLMMSEAQATANAKWRLIKCLASVSNAAPQIKDFSYDIDSLIAHQFYLSYYKKILSRKFYTLNF